MSKTIKTLTIATVIAAFAPVAFAQSPPPYSAGYGPIYPGAPGGYYRSSIAPYGQAVPSYTDYYGTYPAYHYDPDPYLRARLRSEFNLAVDGIPR
jgi:hypothetical protein